MSHNEEKFQIATDIARQIRDKKNDIAGNFLWIALQARKLKTDKTWEAVSTSWDSFCLCPDTGLGMSPSYVRNLISVVKTYIESGLVTSDEAVKIGPHRLQLSKAAVKRIPEDTQNKAVEILLSNSKISDMKASLRELVPEDQRKPLDHEEKFLGSIGKSWALLNECEAETFSDDFVKRTQDYLQKMAGYLQR